MRVSSLDQNPETQLHDLKQMAAQRGYEIVQEYTDRISGAKARRQAFRSARCRTGRATERTPEARLVRPSHEFRPDPD